MDIGLIVVIVVVVLAVLAVAGLSAARARKRKEEEQRLEAAEHRHEAEIRTASADRREAEAAERAARARHEEAQANEQAARAQQDREVAQERQAAADRIDPDADARDRNGRDDHGGRHAARATRDTADAPGRSGDGSLQDVDPAARTDHLGLGDEGAGERRRTGASGGPGDEPRPTQHGDAGVPTRERTTRDATTSGPAVRPGGSGTPSTPDRATPTDAGGAGPVETVRGDTGHVGRAHTAPDRADPGDGRVDTGSDIGRSSQDRADVGPADRPGDGESDAGRTGAGSGAGSVEAGRPGAVGGPGDGAPADAAVPGQRTGEHDRTGVTAAPQVSGPEDDVRSERHDPGRGPMRAIADRLLGRDRTG
jgi:hypothetical protein